MKDNPLFSGEVQRVNLQTLLSTSPALGDAKLQDDYIKSLREFQWHGSGFLGATALPSDKALGDLAPLVLRQPTRFVAIVDADRTFRSLVDRESILEPLAKEFVKQVQANPA